MRFDIVVNNLSGLAWTTKKIAMNSDGSPWRPLVHALDIAVRDGTQALVDTLNEFVIAQGGRVYLAKDSFTRKEHFEQMEPRLKAFLEVRRKWDPKMKFKSAQSVRLFGDPA